MLHVGFNKHLRRVLDPTELLEEAKQSSGSGQVPDLGRFPGSELLLRVLLLVSLWLPVFPRSATKKTIGVAPPKGREPGSPLVQNEKKSRAWRLRETKASRDDLFDGGSP